MHGAADCLLSPQLTCVLSSFPWASDARSIMRAHGKDETCLLGVVDLLLAQHTISPLRPTQRQLHSVVLAIASLGSLAPFGEI